MHIPEAVPSPIPIPFCVSHHLLSIPPTLLFPNLCPFLKSCHGLQPQRGRSRWLVPSNSATYPCSELRTGQWPVGQCDTTYLIFVRSQVTEHRIEKVKLKSQFFGQPAKWFERSHWVPWRHIVSLSEKLYKQCLSSNPTDFWRSKEGEVVNGT